MGLREIAHIDLQSIMSDPSGFVWPCVITSPAGVAISFDSRSNDVHLSIDEDTGDVITARQASVSVLMCDLIASSFESICGVVDTAGAPWLVAFENINGTNQTFKVAETYPDHTLGLMVLNLEVYNV